MSTPSYIVIINLHVQSAFPVKTMIPVREFRAILVIVIKPSDSLTSGIPCHLN